MLDNYTPDLRHRIISQIHSSNINPEVKVCHALWELEFRYRMNDKRFSCSPDIVLPKSFVFT